MADLEVDPSRSLNCSRGAVPCFGYEQWPLRLRLRALALQKGTAKRIIDVYLSIKVYVAPSALSVREKNQWFRFHSPHGRPGALRSPQVCQMVLHVLVLPV